MVCAPADFKAFISRLAAVDAQTDWEICSSYPPPDELPQKFSMVRGNSRIGIAIRLWIRSLFRPFTKVTICSEHIPARGGALTQFISVCRASKRVVMDLEGRETPLSTGAIRGALSPIVVRVLLFIATIVTRCGLQLCRARPEHPPAGGVHGRTALLVPILPDLSHTFVYREVLALKQRHPDYLVVALERGDARTIHGEAQALLEDAHFVPTISPARYLLAYIRNWCVRPRTMSALIQQFQPFTASFGAGARQNDDRCFLRMEYLDHGGYPMRGLVLAEYLRKQQVGYVHVYGSTYPSVRTLVAHTLLNIPYSISTFVDFDYKTSFHMLNAKFRSARFVVGCTDYCVQRLTTRFPDMPSKFRRLHHALRRGYGVEGARRVSDGRSRLVYVGRFVPKKGLDTLLRACVLLRNQGIDFTCHLYGAGEEEGALRTLATQLSLNRHVFFEGPIPNQTLGTTLNRDDLFVCPSRYMEDGERDGIPVTLLEVMAMGVTVLSTHVSGIPELVKHGVNGYLVNPDNPEQLALQIATLLTTPAMRHAVAEAAMQTVRENFSLETNVDELDGWINQETRSTGGMPAPETFDRAEAVSRSSAS